MASPAVPAHNNNPEGEEGLTAEQLATFRRDGYLIIPDALPAATVSGLLAETHSLLESFPLDSHPMTRFRTGGETGEDHVGDNYFLESGDKIRFFFEEDAFDSSGQLTKPKARAINKIGHFLHGLSPPFEALLRPAGSPDAVDGMAARPAAVARSLGFRDPRCLQSMVICKQPEIGGAVPPHQDSTFLYTDPPSAVGFWYALEDATAENGCLSFLPGSHRWARISRRLARRPLGGVGTEMVPNFGSDFPPGDEYRADPPPPPRPTKEKKGDGKEEEGGGDGKAAGDDDGYVLGEVKAGTLVLIHGNLLHKSERNLSQKGRIIYTFHIIEGEGTKYDEKNWLQPPEDGFTRLYT